MHLSLPKVYDPYCITPADLTRKKLALLELKDGDVLYDLGCGNAHALIDAFAFARVKGIGYEIVPEAIEDAKDNIAKAGLTGKIEVRTRDFYDAPFSDATAIVVYLSRSVLGALSLKFEKELKAGTRIVTHQFDIPGWAAEKEIDFVLTSGATERIFLYRKE